MLTVFADRKERADDEGALCLSGIQQLASGQWDRALDALTALLSRPLDAPGKNPAAKILFSRALPHFFGVLSRGKFHVVHQVGLLKADSAASSDLAQKILHKEKHVAVVPILRLPTSDPPIGFPYYTPHCPFPRLPQDVSLYRP